MNKAIVLLTGTLVLNVIPNGARADLVPTYSCTAECVSVEGNHGRFLGSLTAQSPRSIGDAFTALRNSCMAAAGGRNGLLVTWFSYGRVFEADLARPGDPTVCGRIQVDDSMPPIYDGPVGPNGPWG